MRTLEGATSNLESRPLSEEVMLRSKLPGEANRGTREGSDVADRAPVAHNLRSILDSQASCHEQTYSTTHQKPGYLGSGEEDPINWN